MLPWKDRLFVFLFFVEWDRIICLMQHEYATWLVSKGKKKQFSVFLIIFQQFKNNGTNIAVIYNKLGHLWFYLI